MSTPTTQPLEIARLALEACDELVPGPSGSLVELCIDGSNLVALFEVDAAEHDRRTAVGVGAATSTGLLHALWELPEGVQIPRSRLSRRDLSTIETLGHGFVKGADDLTRVYVPAGHISALVVVKRDLSTAIKRTSLLPGIYWRVAAATRSGPPFDEAHATSVRTGVGATVVSGGEVTVVAEPHAPVIGLPAVVRWWLAELAYRNWGYGNCAHCSS